ncbi:Primase zinc finger-containing protein [Elsinoe fawcettii]|nr:Primase zinc finger-containing protein [Elsinoe fawcettii]
MVIVRESPRAKNSPDKNLSNWPPKSPYEALISSPSGKRRWQDRSDSRRRTPSPSPRKPHQQNGKSPQDVLNQLGEPFESDQEDEDEETLKLKLQAIEAKLKLKKLKQAKEKQASSPVGYQDAGSVQGSPRRKKLRLDRDIQVPVSPIRMNTAPSVNKSPARVLLGIDKGIRAEQVSLKRARPATSTIKGNGQRTPPRVKSFTERLAESRDSEVQRQEKAERIQNARGNSFGLANITSSTPRTASSERSGSDHAPPTRKPSLLESARKKSSSSTTTISSLAGPSSTYSAPSQAASLSTRKPKATSKAPMSAEDALTYEPFSGLHLSKRTLPATDLTIALSGKELYPLPRLLKETKSPDYDPPNCESDYVILGIIASKSSPHDIKSGPAIRASSPDSSSTEKKFMVLKLTDLQWEVDLFLFSTAFTKYWKLSPGTLIAVLNPGIMPPRPHARDTGRFSLKLTSSEDEILELGSARDLAFCSSLKKDGQLCNAWINGQKTEHCDFHVNLQLDKARSARMEMNGVFRYTGQKKRGREGSGSPPARGARGFNSYLKAPAPNDSSEGKGKYKGSQRKDFETGETFFMGPSTAVKLLDNEDVMAPERLRKRLKEKEKEKELGEKLGRLGKGLGAEYLRAGTKSDASISAAESRTRGRSPVKQGTASTQFDPDWELSIGQESKPDAAALGLVRKSTDVRLSPVRGRKKALHEQGEAMGWSSAFKRGVLEKNMLGEKRPTSPEKGQLRLSGVRDLSPKKKARFALAKGIREPGRESLGDAIANADDSDDDLDII